MNLALKVAIIRKFGTQADFAMAIGDDETMVSRVIRGRRVLAPKKQEAWAEILDVPIYQIFNSGSLRAGTEMGP
jgi:transcriptional regulator with XRE-family HTH domain